MIGKPKYKRGDIVKFKLEEKEYTGTIYYIDAYGSLENSNDVSYDIFIDNYFKEGDKNYHINGNNGCLLKHITEKLISNKI